jgi:integrase
MTPRLPPFVHGYIDRHGKPRYYLRRKGFVKVPLPGAPWSTQFMDAHAAALAGQPIIEPGRGRAKAGTMNALAMSYMAAPAFTLLADNSRRNYRRAIERFCNQHGDKLVAELQRKHVIKLMAALSDRPQAANQLRKMLRALMQHAVDIDMRPDDPTRDTKPIKIRSGGHHPWTEQEIEQFEQHHPVGTRQRLALDLLLYSGQRSGDVRRMGPQHIQQDVITVRQEKTRTDLSIPIHQRLRETLDATPSGHLTFIVTGSGTPFKAGSFSMWFKKACRAASLPHCCAHGLRHAAARRLADAGATPHEVASITGHRSLSEISRYTKSADQKRLAVSAMSKVKA